MKEIPSVEILRQPLARYFTEMFKVSAEMGLDDEGNHGGAALVGFQQGEATFDTPAMKAVMDIVGVILDDKAFQQITHSHVRLLVDAILSGLPLDQMPKILMSFLAIGIYVGLDAQSTPEGQRPV